MSGPRQRDSDFQDRLARTQSVKDQSQALLSDDGLSGGYKRLKVEYPDKDDTQLMLSDIKGWWQKQRNRCVSKVSHTLHMRALTVLLSHSAIPGSCCSNTLPCALKVWLLRLACGTAGVPIDSEHIPGGIG